MNTPSQVHNNGSEEQSGPPATSEAPATSPAGQSRPPAIRPRGWVGGAVMVSILALVGLGSHGLLLTKAIDVEAVKSAWDAGLAQRTEERKRIDDEIEVARSALGRIKADIRMGDEELSSRQADIAALESVRQKTAEIRESLATASEQLAKARLAKDQAEKATAELEARNASLVGETTQLAEQRKQFVGDIAKAHTELEGLARQVADLSTALGEKIRLDSLAADLQTQVRALEAQRDQLIKAVGPLEQQRAELQIMTSGVAALYGQTAALDVAMVALETRKESLENEVAQARQAVLSAKRDQEIAEKAADDAAAAQSAAEKTRRSVEQAAGDAAARTADADKVRLAAEARLQQVREALAGAEAALQTKQTLVTQKEKELQAMEARLRKMQGTPDAPKSDAPANEEAPHKAETQPGGGQ